MIACFFTKERRLTKGPCISFNDENQVVAAMEKYIRRRTKHDQKHRRT